MRSRSLTIADSLGSIELRHLRSFLAIAESDTVTEAAATLGISQPSLSAQLGFLEDHLGVRLFDRDRLGVRITVDGRRLRDLILGPVVALDAGLLEFRADGLPVHVVVPPDLGRDLREAAQQALLREFPGRPVQWQSLPTRERLAAFRQRTAQALVEWGPMDGVDGLVLHGRSLGVLMSASSTLARLDAVSGEDLTGHLVASLREADPQRSENAWSGLFANGWSPRSGLADIDGLDDLVADPRTVLVAPEPEVGDPRLSWRPFVLPWTESAWLAIC